MGLINLCSIAKPYKSDSVNHNENCAVYQLETQPPFELTTELSLIQRSDYYVNGSGLSDLEIGRLGNSSFTGYLDAGNTLAEINFYDANKEEIV